MPSLKTNWKDLTSRYSEDQQLIEELWVEIEDRYSGKVRHYHNLSHLEYMLNLAMQYKDSIEDFNTLRFSIFYHDIVCNVTKQNNEEKSAEFAADRLSSLGVPEKKIAYCMRQILATKNHNAKGDNDTNYLIDFDLSILGETPDIYKDYTDKIRMEYSIFPGFLYKRGRKKIIQHLLDEERIFKTIAFQNAFEEQARRNLETELRNL